MESLCSSLPLSLTYQKINGNEQDLEGQKNNSTHCEYKSLGSCPKVLRQKQSSELFTKSFVQVVGLVQQLSPTRGVNPISAFRD